MVTVVNYVRKRPQDFCRKIHEAKTGMLEKNAKIMADVAKLLYAT